MKTKEKPKKSNETRLNVEIGKELKLKLFKRAKDNDRDISKEARVILKQALTS